MPKPKLAIDFDGTIACYESGSFREDVCGAPIIGAIEFLRALATKYDLVIFSARASTFRGKNAILQWVRENNLRSIISDVTSCKSYSFVAYIDDRAIAFNNPNDYLSIAESLGCQIKSESPVGTVKNNLNAMHHK